MLKNKKIFLIVLSVLIAIPLFAQKKNIQELNYNDFNNLEVTAAPIDIWILESADNDYFFYKEFTDTIRSSENLIEQNLNKASNEYEKKFSVEGKNGKIGGYYCVDCNLYAATLTRDVTIHLYLFSNNFAYEFKLRCYITAATEILKKELPELLKENPSLSIEKLKDLFYDWQNFLSSLEFIGESTEYKMASEPKLRFSMPSDVWEATDTLYEINREREKDKNYFGYVSFYTKTLDEFIMQKYLSWSFEEKNEFKEKYKSSDIFFNALKNGSFDFSTFVGNDVESEIVCKKLKNGYLEFLCLCVLDKTDYSDDAGIYYLYLISENYVFNFQFRPLYKPSKLGINLVNPEIKKSYAKAIQAKNSSWPKQLTEFQKKWEYIVKSIKFE